MTNTQTWYIVKRPTGNCEIVSSQKQDSDPQITDRWGPFSSADEALARRVGLIRAGKCQPV